uniref:Uncharacterized protein n=1 Tax=Romanomermis culicivorax TaxID=13658 RepID=A0A915HQ52_ROMCU
MIAVIVTSNFVCIMPSTTRALIKLTVRDWLQKRNFRQVSQITQDLEDISKAMRFALYLSSRYFRTTLVKILRQRMVARDVRH